MTRILFFGASIDHGFWDTEGGWIQRLRRDLDRYSMENEKDYSLYNLSISGDTTERILERLENEVKARKNSEDIHIYLEVGGGNDSQVELETGENWIPRGEYQKNLQKILEIAEEHGDQIVLFTTTPVDESEVYPMPWKQTHGYLNSEKEKYTETLEEFAEENRTPVVNFFNKIDREEWKEKLDDGVHPDTEGHEQLHKLAKKQLQEKDLIPKNL